MLTEASRTRLGQALAGYDGRQFDFRVWWVREYGIIKAADKRAPARCAPATCSRYITQRKVWNPTGGMKEWLYVEARGLVR